MPFNHPYKPDSKNIAHIIAPSRDITKALTDELLETQPHLSDDEKWRISSGQISKRELDMLIPALRQGSYVDPQIAKHIPFHHRTIHDTSLSYIRTFVQQLSLTQDIIANNHDVARYATSEWTPTLEDFRYDWTQPITSSLNAEAIRVIAVGILSDFTQGNYIETALDGAPTFPDLYQRVQSHFRYLRKKVKATKSRGGEGTEARAIAKRKVRLRHRCKAKFVRRLDTANTFKEDWGVFLPFLQRVGQDYMSDEESERDVAGVPYLAIRAPAFRADLAKDVFNALDVLANKLDEGQRDALRQKCRPKYERCPAKDGVPSRQRPPAYLPRNCYDEEWLREDASREIFLRPAPAMDLGLGLK